MGESLSKWLDTSILKEMENHYYRVVIRVINIIPKMEGIKIADLKYNIGPLRKEDVLTVSITLGRVLEKMGIAEIIMEVP